MRLTPPTIAIATALALTASVGQGQQKPALAPHAINPRSMALVQSGNMAMVSGALDRATDNYETALAVDPGNVDAYIGLAQVARRQNLPGKALRHYREALSLDPNNMAAIEGQGEAFAARGAITRAKESLARLTILCQGACMQRAQLASAIDRAQLAAQATKSPLPAPPAKARN